MNRIYLFILVFMLFGLNGVRAQKTDLKDSLINEMSEMMTAILGENYGEDSSVKERYLRFFKDFDSGLAGVILRINKHSLKEINDCLFRDSVYYSIYCKVLSYDLGEPRPVFPLDSAKYYAVVRRPKIRSDSRFFYPITWIANHSELAKVYLPDHLFNILNDYPAYGSLDYCGNVYFLVTVLQNHPEELELPSVRKYVALKFWPYLCYCSNYDFYERKYRSKDLLAH